MLKIYYLPCFAESLESLHKSEIIIMAIEFIICPSQNILNVWSFGKIFAVDGSPTSFSTTFNGLYFSHHFTHVTNYNLSRTRAPT